MDITADFGSAIPGSNPGQGTTRVLPFFYSGVPLRKIGRTRNEKGGLGLGRPDKTNSEEHYGRSTRSPSGLM